MFFWRFCAIIIRALIDYCCFDYSTCKQFFFEIKSEKFVLGNQSNLPSSISPLNVLNFSLKIFAQYFVNPGYWSLTAAGLSLPVSVPFSNNVRSSLASGVLSVNLRGLSPIATLVDSAQGPIFKKSTAIREQAIISNTSLRFKYRYGIPANILQEYK